MILDRPLKATWVFRGMSRPKVEKKGTPKKSFRSPQRLDFLAGQDYSLMGCSPAAPISASSWIIKLSPTILITQKVIHIFGVLGREPVKLFHEGSGQSITLTTNHQPPLTPTGASHSTYRSLPVLPPTPLQRLIL